MTITASNSHQNTAQESFTVTPSVSAPPAPALTIEPAAPVICAETSLTFTALPVNFTGTLSYQWQVNGQNAGGNGATYQLTVTATSGCQSSIAITVTVLEPIVIPNAFTPNGDGINDTWNIAYLSDYTHCTVDVFARYGQQIFHSNGYPVAWNGTYSGKSLPVETYYYVIDLKNNTAKLSGFVTIVR